MVAVSGSTTFGSHESEGGATKGSAKSCPPEVSATGQDVATRNETHENPSSSKN